jgi:hypothetical protein
MTIQALNSLNASDFGYTYRGTYSEDHLQNVQAIIAEAQNIIAMWPQLSDDFNSDDVLDFVNTTSDTLNDEENDELMIVVEALHDIEQFLDIEE